MELAAAMEAEALKRLSRAFAAWKTAEE